MHCNRGKMEVYEALVNAFREGKAYESGMDELARARELAEKI
jgi:hypothetical protein